MAYSLTLSITLNASQTGLTLKGQLVDTVGSNVGGEITTGFFEVGVGNYMLTASVPDSHQGGIKILKSDGTLVGFCAINPQQTENADVKTSTRLATSGYTAPDNALIGAIAGYVDTEVAAIKAKTDNLPASPAAAGDIPSAAAIRSEIDANSTKLDVAVSTRAAASAYTSARAALLDNLDASVSTRLASASYTAPDNAGIGTLLARLTVARALLLDNLALVDQAISSIPTAAEIDAQLSGTHGDDSWEGGGGSGSDFLETLVPGDYEPGTAGAALGRISSAKITTVSPVSVSGDMQIIRGDDYSADDGALRVFEWSDDESVWPDLDGATITFKCNSVEATAEFAEGTPNKVRLELPNEQTSALPTGRPRFSISATLANEHVVTLIVGSIRYTATEGLA